MLLAKSRWWFLLKEWGGGANAREGQGLPTPTGLLVRHQPLSHLGQDLQASGAHTAPNPERKAWVSLGGENLGMWVLAEGH